MTPVWNLWVAHLKTGRAAGRTKAWASCSGREGGMLLRTGDPPQTTQWALNLVRPRHNARCPGYLRCLIAWPLVLAFKLQLFYYNWNKPTRIFFLLSLKINHLCLIIKIFLQDTNKTIVRATRKWDLTHFLLFQYKYYSTTMFCSDLVLFAFCWSNHNC